MARVLNPQQRQEYNQLLRNEGQDAAKAFRDNIIQNKAGSGGNVQPQGSVGGAPISNKITQMISNQQRAQAAGKNKKAAKIGNRILNKISKDPLSGIGLGQQMADYEFGQNLLYNRPNQQTIGGNRQYVTNPDGSVSVVDTLDEGQQALYEGDLAARQAANQAFMSAFGGQQFGQAYDLSGLPQAPIQQDLASERARIEDAFFNRESELINRQADRERERIEQQLYMRGNVPGTPAYENAMKQFNEGLNQQLEAARMNAVQQGGAEFERMFNIGTQGRQSALNEMVFGRTQPLAELQALQGMGGGPTMLPNFFGFQPIQYAGPQLSQFMGLGLEAELGRGQLDVSRQAANRAGGGGGGYAGPSFSIGGFPDSGLPPAVNAPNPAAAGFAAGLQQGAALGFQ